MRALPPPRHEAQITLPGVVEVTTTSLTIDPNATRDQWAEIGGGLARIESGYQWWIADWWNHGEAYGDRVEIARAQGLEPDFCRDVGWVGGNVSLRKDTLTFTHHKEVAALEPDKQAEWLDWAERNGPVDEATGERKPVSTRELRAEIRRPKDITPPPPPEPNTYNTLVVDPPWEIEKIARDVRPNQKAMDYPSIPDDDLYEWGLKNLVTAARDDAHLYLWTTHKKLPLALELVEHWGFNYQCLLTWVKNVGFTPFSWMYSTELIIFARRGNLELLKLGKRLDFSAAVREHSRKPDEFYDLVREVSPGPRLDMFSRESRDGFDSWGAEDGKFDELSA